MTKTATRVIDAVTPFAARGGGVVDTSLSSVTVDFLPHVAFATMAAMQRTGIITMTAMNHGSTLQLQVWSEKSMSQWLMLEQSKLQ